MKRTFDFFFLKGTHYLTFLGVCFDFLRGYFWEGDILSYFFTAIEGHIDFFLRKEDFFGIILSLGEFRIFEGGVFGRGRFAPNRLIFLVRIFEFRKIKGNFF